MAHMWYVNICCFCFDFCFCVYSHLFVQSGTLAGYPDDPTNTVMVSYHGVAPNAKIAFVDIGLSEVSPPFLWKSVLVLI
jgi:hypothetical protein